MTRFVSHDKLLEATRVVAECVDPHAALVGGFAMQAFGSRRLTADLDFLVDAVPDDSVARHVVFGRRLTFGGIKASVIGVPVDFIARDDEAAALYQAAHTAAVVVQGLHVRVVPPEWLVLLKLYAGRPKDHLDIETVFGWKSIDREKIYRLAKRFLGIMAVKGLQQMAEIADWKRSRPGFVDEDEG